MKQLCGKWNHGNRERSFENLMKESSFRFLKCRIPQRELICKLVTVDNFIWLISIQSKKKNWLPFFQFYIYFSIGDVILMPMHFIRSNNIGVSKFCLHTYIVKYMLLSMSFYCHCLCQHSKDWCFQCQLCFSCKKTRKKGRGREGTAIFIIHYAGSCVKSCSKLLFESLNMMLIYIAILMKGDEKVAESHSIWQNEQCICIIKI